MVRPAALCLLAFAGQAGAAGLGPGDPGATLGQPLNFEVAVRLDAGEVLSPECVSADVAIGDRRVPPPQVRTLIETTSATAARLRVQTQGNVDEPVVQVQLVVGCSNRIARSYVVFADPPGMDMASPTSRQALAASPPAVLAAVSAARGVESMPATSAEPPRTASSPALTAQQVRAREELRARLREERLSRQRAAREARERTDPDASGAAPRLQLDRAEVAPRSDSGTPQPDAVAQAMAAVAEAASAAQAAASAASASAQRVAALELELAQLRNEGMASRGLITALREQLAEAQSSARWTLPLVLAWLLLAAVAAWLAWRLGRVQAAQREQWQQEAGVFGRAGPDTSVSGLGSLDATPSTRTPTAPVAFMSREGRRSSPFGSSPESGGVPATGRKLAAASARAQRAWPPAAPPLAWPAPPTTLPPGMRSETLPGHDSGVKAQGQPRAAALFEPDGLLESPMHRTEAQPAGGRGSEASPRDVSIEELLDLEQQAEFFMALEQDEAAVDLLVEHLRSTGGGSPLPYLKLLEIHHRRADHAAYERMRQRFNHRFNAYAPEWGVDLTSGRSLEDYPGIIPRLQQVWDRPLDAMAELEALLFRKSRGELFDLPAYREVLFLYALERDLLDRDVAGAGSVDLLLPINDVGDKDTTTPASLRGLDHDAFKDTMPPDDRLGNVPVDFVLTGGDRYTSVFDRLDQKTRP
jgi:pilus assembly protein FimV